MAAIAPNSVLLKLLSDLCRTPCQEPAQCLRRVSSVHASLFCASRANGHARKFAGNLFRCNLADGAQSLYLFYSPHERLGSIVASSTSDKTKRSQAVPMCVSAQPARRLTTVLSLFSLPIHTIREVAVGKKTKALSAFAEVKELLCFSLVAADFTLELEAAAPDVANEWVLEINRLRNIPLNKSARLMSEGTNITRCARLLPPYFDSGDFGLFADTSKARRPRLKSLFSTAAPSARALCSCASAASASLHRSTTRTTRCS
jgi:hypothetical protein